MDSAPSMDTVIQALNVLYHQQDAAGKEKASAYLNEMQKSVKYPRELVDDTFCAFSVTVLVLRDRVVCLLLLFATHSNLYQRLQIAYR